MAKILVIGDLMIDRYLWGNCERISPEAPVQIVDIKNENFRLGGCGNVIANLKALDVEVGVLSVIGDDLVGENIIDLLKNLNVCIEKIICEKNRKSGQKTRLMALHQQVIRFDKESKDEINITSQNEIISHFKKIICKYDGVLLSDYAKGVLSPNLCQNVIKIANENSKFILIDPKGKDYSKYADATLLTPNLKEASVATNIKITDEISLKQAIVKLKFDLNLDYSIITMSEKGIALYDEELCVIPAIAKEVFDVTGAGDTVLAALGYALANHLDIKSAISLANTAAAIVVGKVGSASASLKEINEYGKFNTKYEKIKTIDEICEILTNCDKKIVFTNGCFDILHAGHVKYLQKARNLGDILIVGLNSDASIKQLKGKNRPINSLKNRAIVLSALECVDFVVVFDDLTPLNIIKRIKPDILAKGADYANKEIVGSGIAKEVVLIEFEEGLSTTNLIKKIKDEI